MTPSFVEWVLDRLDVLMRRGDPANKAPVTSQSQDSTKPEVAPDSGNSQ